MTPIDDGRLCGKCEKRVVDMRGMSDQEIARMHAEAGRALCGAFTPEQVARWSARCPSSVRQPALVTLTLGASLLGVTAAAQPSTASVVSADTIRPAATDTGTVAADSLRVRGTVRDGEGRPLPGVQISVATIGTLSDSAGQYSLVVPRVARQGAIALKFARLEFESAEVLLVPDEQGEVVLDTALTPSEVHFEGIIVEAHPGRPSFWTRFWRRIR